MCSSFESHYSVDVTSAVVQSELLSENYYQETPVDCVLGQMKSCDCSCSNLENALENDPVLKAKMEKLAKEMTVDVKNTSAHLRSLTSASDDRPSAQAAGYVGITILTLVFGLLLFFDGVGVAAQGMLSKQKIQ